MTARTETQTTEDEAEPDAIFGVLEDPRQIPNWAPAFADAITGDAERGWEATKDGRAFTLRVVASRSSRTVDYLREIAPGREGGAYLRVLQGPKGGSVIVMTLPLPPVADPTTVAATLTGELKQLVQLARRPPSGAGGAMAGDHPVVAGEPGRQLGMMPVGPAHQARLDPPGLQRRLPGVGMVGRVRPDHPLVAPDQVVGGSVIDVGRGGDHRTDDPRTLIHPTWAF